MAFNDNVPTRQGTWEDDLLIIDIAPSSIKDIYDIPIEFDRSKRVTITSKSGMIRSKYGEYDTIAVTEDFSGDTLIKVPVTEDRNTLTVFIDRVIYNLTYNINSENLIDYTISNSIQFNHTVKQNTSQVLPTLTYKLDDNKYVIRKDNEI